MTLPINLSTGPVSVSPEVMKALSEPPISHRSAAFSGLYEKTTGMLCELFNVQQTYLLTGSGTLANECMLQEIKQIDGPGLVLSNGEFGSRLMQQCGRNNIPFFSYRIEWGQVFDLAEIESLMKLHSVQWTLFCHCETSTGVINDIENLSTLCRSNSSLCFVDCMSTVGTTSLDLSGLAMATASSGKGFASIPGLGIVFSNRPPLQKNVGPVYLDLAHYHAQDGIPFTISSNLVKALYVSICQKQNGSQYDLLQEYGNKIYTILNRYDLVPFSHSQSKVFTIVHNKNNNRPGRKRLRIKPLLLSYESDYLKTRGWQQLAMFGYYNSGQLKRVVSCLASPTFIEDFL